MARKYSINNFESLLPFVLGFSVIGNVLVLAIAYLIQYPLLVKICFTLIICTLISWYFFRKAKAKFATHFIMLSYLIIYSASSFTAVAKYPIILLFPIIVELAILFFTSHKTRLFYTLLAIVGCFLHVQFGANVEGVGNLMITGIISFAMLAMLFLLAMIHARILAKYQMALEHKQDALIAQNQKLREYIDSNMQLEQFAHVTSHDLRSPMITINSFSKLLKSKVGEKLNEKEQVYLDFIQTNSQQLLNLLEDILEYSKLNAQKLHFSNCSTADLVSEVTDLLAFAAKEKKVHILLSNTLPTIIADETKLKRVFQNLINNAIKFSDTQRTSTIKINAIESEEFWQFNIIDNGIGIDERNGVNIFKPYTRLNLKSKYEGSGLGLSICKKIVEQHSGTINYHSKTGKGSHFYFTISKDLQASTMCKVGTPEFA